ncbi:hypothetical protein B0H14DRAFT_2586873 [Mycena olivaceomarginata]|nr:hypothetical protein B0H14DRAFT_2586873 [Mycena olivaceomarginata]
MPPVSRPLLLIWISSATMHLSQVWTGTRRWPHFSTRSKRLLWVLVPTADEMELDGVEMISLEVPVEPDIQPDALEQGNDVDASEASRPQSGNLDVHGGVMSMGNLDIVVPSVVSGEDSINSGATTKSKKTEGSVAPEPSDPGKKNGCRRGTMPRSHLNRAGESSGTQKDMQGQLELKKLKAAASHSSKRNDLVNGNKGTHPVRASSRSLRRFLVHILEPGSLWDARHTGRTHLSTGSTFEVKVVEIGMESVRVNWVDIPIRNKNKVTAKRYTDEKARIISKQASAKNMMQMRKQEE